MDHDMVKQREDFPTQSDQSVDGHELSSLEFDVVIRARAGAGAIADDEAKGRIEDGPLRQQGLDQVPAGGVLGSEVVPAVVVGAAQVEVAEILGDGVEPVAALDHDLGHGVAELVESAALKLHSGPAAQVLELFDRGLGGKPLSSPATEQRPRTFEGDVADGEPG
jgi:hypothetical protein